jgi:RNA polymerase sigma-70 factor (ECF subfamily)
MTPERLHARYADKIDRQVRRVLGSDADCEDLVQEVLMVVFQNFHTIREPKAADAWVRQVTATMTIDLVRSRSLRRQVSSESLPETALPLWRHVEGPDVTFRIVRLLRQLPAKERSLLMSYWFTPSTAEALAREQGCSVATMRRRVFRARTRFQRLARHDMVLARYVPDPPLSSRRVPSRA